MGCFCFVSFGRTVSSMLLQKKKLVTEVTWGWRKFKVISEEIVNEQKSLHFAMPFLSTQKGYDFVMSAMKHWLFAFWGGVLDSWISWHYCLDTHHSTCTAIFIRKKLKCYDMISVCHTIIPPPGLVGGLMWSSTLRNGGFRWLDAFLAWHTVSQSPGDCRGHKNATKKGWWNPMIPWGWTGN